MALYIVFRPCVYTEKCVIEADSEAEARDKAANDEYEDILDLDPGEVVGDPSDWEVVEA